MAITIDKRSWQLGYEDGVCGRPLKYDSTIDGLSYSAGWVEGDARESREGIRWGRRTPQDPTRPSEGDVDEAEEGGVDAYNDSFSPSSRRRRG
jgi:hypothetical protein